MDLAVLVLFEGAADVGEGEELAVDDELEVAGVFRDGDDGVDLVAAKTQLLNEQIDIEHRAPPVSA